MRSLRYVTEGSAKICWATNNSGVQGSAATREGRPWLNPRSLPPTHGARSSPGRQHPCLHDRRSAGQLQQLPQQLLVALPLLAGVFLVGMLVGIFDVEVARQSRAVVRGDVMAGGVDGLESIRVRMA